MMFNKQSSHRKIDAHTSLALEINLRIIGLQIIESGMYHFCKESFQICMENYMNGANRLLLIYGEVSARI